MTGVTGWFKNLHTWAGDSLAPRVCLLLGIGMTMATNITAGIRGGRAGGAIIAGGFAVALLASLETLIWMIRRTDRWTSWHRWAGLGLCAVCAGLTGWVSYTHARTVLEWTGTGGEVGRFAPAIPDQLILMGSVALMTAAAHHKRRRAATPDQRTIGPDQRATGPRTTVRAPRPARDPVAEAQLVDVARGLPKVPAERAFATAYCGGNRRMARRVLTAARGGGDG